MRFNLHITTLTSRLVAERGYYPYGLPFGQHQDWTATDRNTIAPGLPGFTGQEGADLESWETMFQNFGARYYDSQIGRWHAPDPAWVGFSPYEYCHGNPAGMVDPDGREPITAAIIIGAAIGAYMGGSIANNNWDPTAWKFTGPDAWKTYTGILLGGAVGALGGAYAGAAMAKAGAFGAMKVKTKYMVTKILGKSAMNKTAMCPTGGYKVVVPKVSNTITLSGTASPGTTMGAVAGGKGAGGVALASAGQGAGVAAAVNDASGDGLGLFDPSRPDEDGYLTFNEATYWWQSGKGVDLSVDYEKYSELWNSRKLKRFFKEWAKEPFRGKSGRAFNFFDNLFEDWNSDAAKVFGNLTFQRVGKHRFELPTHDFFNWESHGGVSARNFYTWVGRNFVVGSGKTYKINFFGKWFLRF